MSKVYKSRNVSIGIPKHIVHVFRNETIKEEEQKTINNEDKNPADEEEYANSIVEDAKQMYLKIIEEANAEARRIMEAAEAEADNLLSSSRENGYKEGYESGYLEGKNGAQSIIDEASEIKTFLDMRRESLYREAEEQIVDLVLSISKKVIGQELSQNREALLSLVNQALQKCAFKNKLVLKISPLDFDFIKENKYRICKMVEGISDIDIVSDLSLQNGSCIIETPSGEINSSIDVQLEEIEKIFTYIYRENNFPSQEE
ncbi:MAG TPA: FliH/SctL family protein [Bacillota bacterium]|nr:FliH/SctL family protein [Bacillota bacterium]HQE65467.1 FliH/SctL family protein [Bacillota bacterium]HQJ36881.1 FliH/SctL family protein [Bacillota bacterium]HQL36941.1 FliH/SctL family protein [Bacillota bacterium]HRU40504.1 FliH/SctL family protein [Candidatus Diapherotrites archaeon]